MLDEYYKAFKTIKDGCDRKAITKLLPGLREEIASMKDVGNVRLISNKATAEVSNALTEILANLQSAVFGNSVAAQLVLAIAYLRHDPDFVEIILDFYPSKK